MNVSDMRVCTSADLHLLCSKADGDSYFIWNWVQKFDIGPKNVEFDLHLFFAILVLPKGLPKRRSFQNAKRAELHCCVI